MRPYRLPVAITAAGPGRRPGRPGGDRPADAGPPGTWSTISGGGLSNIIEPGMYRTADGTLHVAIVRGNSDDTESIDVAHVSESGQLLGRTEVIPHWSGVTADPELVGSPSGGLRLVFGGHRTVEFGEPYNGASSTGPSPTRAEPCGRWRPTPRPPTPASRVRVLGHRRGHAPGRDAGDGVPDEQRHLLPGGRGTAADLVVR